MNLVMPLLFKMALLGTVTAVLAKRKGYNGTAWFIGGGIIPIIVLAFLPLVKKGEPETEQQQLTGNFVGLFFAVVNIGLLVVGFFLGGSSY